MERKRKILYVGEFSGLSTGYATISKNLLAEFVKTGKYEVAELAGYYKETDPYHASQAKQFPWKIYGNLPVNDSEQQIYNSHPQNEFGRWKFDYVCLDFQPDIVCFPPGSNVITNNKLENIENIQIGDYVLTHKGRYSKVVKTYKREYDDDLVVININNNNETIKVTPEHPFLVCREKFYYWKNAKDLKKGDLLCFPKYTDFNNNIIDKDFARILGYYVAEGCLLYEGKCINNNIKGIQFTFNIREIGYVDDIKNVLNAMGYDKISIKYPKYSKAIIVRVYSKELGEYVNKYIPGKSATKRISNDIILSSLDIQKELLSGIFRVDGGLDDRRGYYNTRSKELAYQVFQMCINNNIMPCMEYNKNTLDEKIIYRYMFGFHGVSFSNFKEIYFRTFNIQNHPKINDDYALLRIKKIGIEKYTGYVYNLEVKNDNSYVSTAICHNCDVRDMWMQSFIDQSPFRKFFQTVFMPTVDAKNQNVEWLDLYIRTNHILTYTDFAYKVLADEGGGLVPLRGIATPAVNIDVYKPVADKRKHKEQFGLDPDSIIIGMVARNQRRKMFPDLIEAFNEFICKANFKDTNNVYLYLHTAHPDLGWDLPKYFKENGLARKVIMTYFCHACRRWFPSFYSDALTICRFCGQKSAPLSNSQIGIETDALASVYNFMDLYVQFITNEGLGIPCLEAAACGCPFAATNYSGTEDLINKIGGKAISPRTLFHEAETSRVLSYPSIGELVEYINEFVSLPESIRMRMSRRTAELTRQHYGGWSSVAKTWMDIFDSIEIPQQNPWLSPIDILPTQNIQIPDPSRVSDEQFIGWCVGEILHRPDWINGYIGLKMLRDLTWGRTIVNNLGFFFGEMSQVGAKVVWEPCDRNKIMQFTRGLREQYNQSENMRSQYITSGRIS